MADDIAGAVADQEHVSASTERPNPSFDLSDDLLDKYLGEPDTEAVRGRATTKTAKSPASNGKGTRSNAKSDPDELEDDTDEDTELGGDDDEDEELDRLLGEDEEEGDDSEESDEDEEEDAEFLSEFNRKQFLEKYKDNPDVLKAYKSFQADYTKSKQEFAAKEREWEPKLAKAAKLKEEYQTFASTLADDKGMSDFLINVALHRPEVFDKAYEQALSLSEDKDQKAQYLKEKELESRQEKLDRLERESQQKAFKERVSQIESLYQRAANRLGLTSEAHLKIAERFVATAIRDARDDGKDITNEDIVAAVKEAAKELGVSREQARKQAEAELRKKQRQDTRAKAKDARRSPPPRGKASASPPRGEQNSEIRRKGPIEDPMDTLVDSFFN